MKTSRVTSVVALTLASLSAACAVRDADSRSAAFASYPLLRIEAHDHAYRAPARVETDPAGLVRVRLVNHGAVWHEALIVRLASASHGARDYVDSVRAGAAFPGFATDVGGPGLTVPRDSGEIVLALPPGYYALACWFAGHVRQGQVHDFEVMAPVEREIDEGAAAAGARAGPTPDLTLTMYDYNFELSAPLEAGPQVIQVENRGPQAHEVDFFRLLPGRSARDYLSWVRSKRVGPAPAVPVGGTLDFAPGGRVWLAVSFEVGRYFVVCHVPDAGSDRPHYEHGMIREFLVAASP